MPPKEKLTKEQIVARAFEMLRKNGYESLNARALAAELGCSTMPLFRHFSGIGEIRSAAINMAIERYSEYMREGLREPIPFKGVGQAYIRFAKDEPQLFKLFFMTPEGTVAELPPGDPMLPQVLPVAASAAGNSAVPPEKVLYTMWIFVHGLASMIVMGTMAYDEKAIGAMTSEVFAALREKWIEDQKEEKKE